MLVTLLKMLQRCLYIPETSSLINDRLATRSRLMFARYLIDPGVSPVFQKRIVPTAGVTRPTKDCQNIVPF
jgi:hypothetical protein